MASRLILSLKEASVNPSRPWVADSGVGETLHFVSRRSDVLQGMTGTLDHSMANEDIELESRVQPPRKLWVRL